jgi:hypothetical protein
MLIVSILKSNSWEQARKESEDINHINGITTEREFVETGRKLGKNQLCYLCISEQIDIRP